MKQGKPTVAGADSLFIDQLRKLHDDLCAVGRKAMDCVLPAKIHAKSTEFLRGLGNAPDFPLRAMHAAGYATDALLFTPSMGGHTAIDRAMRTGKVAGAEKEAANLLRQATFRLLEIAEDRGGGLLGATDLVSNERLTIFDPDSPMARGSRWARRTCLHKGVHLAVGPVTRLDDAMLAVAAPFMDQGRGLKKPLRCAEALYEHCDPARRSPRATRPWTSWTMTTTNFLSALRTARFTPWRRNGLRRASFRSRTPRSCI